MQILPTHLSLNRETLFNRQKSVTQHSAPAPKTAQVQARVNKAWRDPLSLRVDNVQLRQKRKLLGNAFPPRARCPCQAARRRVAVIPMILGAEVAGGGRRVGVRGGGAKRGGQKRGEMSKREISSRFSAIKYIYCTEYGGGKNMSGISPGSSSSGLPGIMMLAEFGAIMVTEFGV
ncbi:hypothetical protein B0H10DRAFT_1960780 [Mycena sp. CBHHK59/15]|nr:hypothetical protein B0H10DRAFT_1960780 [Mycena sp. CBHHK59/15]